MNPVHEEIYKNHIIRIEADGDTESPEHWDDDCYLCLNLPRHVTIREKECDEIIENGGKKPGFWVFKVYGYIHSGISLNFGGPRDAWDSGLAGVMVANKSEFKSRDHAKKQAKFQLDSWNQWLNGDVYQFVILTTERCAHCNHVAESVLESCGGIYGLEDTVRAAKEQVDSLV